jgi:gliding motility-associated lipoprotein GldH
MLRGGCLIIMGICLGIACQPDADLEVMLQLPNKSWPYSRVVVIPYHNTDTLRPRQILLRLRHSGDYPYRNLHTLCHLIGPEGDTTVVQGGTMLSDPEGRWLGQSTMGDLYTLSDTIMRDFRFRRQGVYRFRIQQHMRINPVPSVEEVGLSIR